MSLFTVISQRNHQQPVFLLGEEVLAVPQLLEIRSRYSGLIGSVAAKSIALCLTSVSALAKCILLFDGVCSKITLMPREVNADVLQKLLADCGAQSVISDYLTPATCPVPLFSFSEYIGALPLAEYDTEWLLPTSGTTGTPKLIPHSISSLSRTIKFDGGKGSSLCWGTLYDIGRFAGLQVYLQALLGGSSLALPDAADLSLPGLLTALHNSGVNALSATPTMWQKILMTDSSEYLNLKQITLGGEIVRQRVLDALAARFPHARITHIYASTEFGVGFSVTDGREGFPIEWLCGDRAICRIDAVNGELLLRKGDEWFATGDLVAEYGDRILFQGRINGSINVGGNKVMPEEVERILLQYPGVLVASVSAQKSSFMGNLVQAEIVAHCEGKTDEFRKGLIAYCRQHLESYKVPAFIKLVDDVSTSSSGKIIRNGGCS